MMEKWGLKLLERRTGSYVVAKYTENTTRRLMNWAGELEIPNLVNVADIHTTILYSRAELPEEHRVCMSERDFLGCAFRPKSLKKVGTSEGKIALALVVEAAALVKLHEKLKSVGGTHPFDDFLPHVTLSYEIPEGLDVDSLSVPNFVLSPKSVETLPLNVNWRGEDVQ